MPGTADTDHKGCRRIPAALPNLPALDIPDLGDDPLCAAIGFPLSVQAAAIALFGLLILVWLGSNLLIGIGTALTSVLYLPLHRSVRLA